MPPLLRLLEKGREERFIMAETPAAPREGDRRIGDRELAVARVYARAGLEVAEPQGQAEELGEELESLAGLLDASGGDLERFLGSPLVEEGARRKVLERALRGKASDLLVDFLQVVNRKGRLGLLRAVAQAYRAELRELRGIVEARVTTAVPLTPELRRQAAEAVARFTGRRPELTEAIDPALLGGMVVEVAGQKIDTSLATRLRELSKRMLAHSTQDIVRRVAESPWLPGLPREGQ